MGTVCSHEAAGAADHRPVPRPLLTLVGAMRQALADVLEHASNAVAHTASVRLPATETYSTTA